MPEGRLDSWKEIAAHLGRSVRTVQRWESQEGLPVHRLQHDKLGSVYAFTSELDAWWEARRISLEAKFPVEEISAQGAPAQPDAVASLPQSGRGRPLRLLPWLAGLGLLAAGVAAWYVRGRSAMPKGPLRIAILPFANLTGDAEREYITDGLTEELIADLGRVKDLGVIARTSVMKFKGGTKTIADIARELAVDYVLEGSVREAGQRLRVTAQLIRAKDEAHVWAETYDREIKDLLSVQTEVALRVAREARLYMPPPRAPGADGEAYLAYLRGRYFWNERSEEGFRKGLVEFERALAKDPRFAPAWSGLADTYALMSNYGMARPREVMPKAGEAARKAVALDDRLAEGHASLALVLSSYDWDFPGAEREFQSALRLNPNYALAHLWYGLMLERLGRLPEARSTLERGLEADPLSAVLRSNLDDFDFRSRRYEEALARYRATLEREPDRAFSYFDLARGQAALGRFGEAVVTMKRARELRGEDPMFEAFAAYIRARAGDRTSAAATLIRLESATKHHVPPYYLALVATGLGDNGRALAHLERAFEERHVGAVSIKEDPEFDPLRSDPRFQDLLRRVGFDSPP